MATYYNAPAFVTPLVARVDPHVDFSGATRPVASMASATSFSVRWGGSFLAPSPSYACTFFLGTSSSTQKARLTVDNSLLIDRWAGGAGTESSAATTLPLQNAFYDLLVEYENTGGVWGYRLSFACAGAARAPLPSSRVFWPLPAPGSPFALTVGGVQIPCAATSTLTTPPATATAGVAMSFTITAKDSGSVSLSAPAFADFAVAVDTFEPLTNLLIHATVAAASAPTWAVGLTLTRAGAYALSAVGLRRGGLMATFLYPPPTPVLTAVSAGVDFSWGTTPPLSCIPTGAKFAVRWGGYLWPALTDVFHFKLDFDDSGELWIDDALTVQSLSLAGVNASAAAALSSDRVYKLTVFYQQAGGSAHARLLWKRAGALKYSAVPTTALFYAVGHVASSPYALTVVPRQTPPPVPPP